MEAEPHGIPNSQGVTVPYTEYVVKAGETTLHQIARDQLYDESRFKEIKGWKNNTYHEVTAALVPNQVLVIPPISPDIATFRLTSPSGSNVRSAHDLNSNVLLLAPVGMEFHYSKKSLTADSAGRVWVEVRTFRDAKNQIQKAGWICVKEGVNQFTNPPISAGRPTG